MQYNIDEADILQQVLAFMHSLNIQPYDESKLVLDGEIHRYRTHDDKRGSTSGAYQIHTDGNPAGFVQDWRKGIKENWSYSTDKLDKDKQSYFNSEEFKKKKKEAEAKREKEALEASEKARILFEQMPPAPENHPYLQRKNVNSYGLKIHSDTKNLAVPLKDITGKVVSIQWIPGDKNQHKLFFAGASRKGAFWSIALDIVDKDKEKDIILMGEGYATMAKIYELTGCPCVAAMSCNNYVDTAKIIRKEYPKIKIIVMADNDWETEKQIGENPGIREAKALLSLHLANDIIYPEFSDKDIGCSDWDDFALKYGDDKALKVLDEKIRWAAMSDKEKEESRIRSRLQSKMHKLNPSAKIPPLELIGGIFPRRYVSLLIAPPGTGKTIFVQKFVSDLSLGGSVFGGFIDEEPVRQSLILAGEAGYELLLRRAASMKWAVNPENINIFDQYEAELDDISITLDSREGVKNVERLIDMYKPDILFVDTLSSFHESDENKADAMKPIIKKMAILSRRYDLAIVLVHHSRKRAAKERSLALTQDDVIGSSILNRYVGLIVGIEPMKDNEQVLLVQSLKSWEQKFTPFTYTLKENFSGGTTVETDLAPAGINNSKASVWYYLNQNFASGEWFSLSQIIVSEIECPISSERQLRRILTDFVKNGRLDRRGSNKSTEYCIPKK